MAQVSYPGVYIDEVPSGVRAITGVSTSIAAFVDRFRRGPVNKAVQIFGMADFERVFGGVDAQSPASYGIAQFFQNGGQQAWVVRVARGIAPLPSSARVTIRQHDSDTTTAVTLAARDPGAWANGRLRVRVDYPGSGTTVAGSDVHDLTVIEYDSARPDARPLRQERFARIRMTAPPDRDSIEAALERSSLVAIVNPLGTVQPATNGLYWRPTAPAAFGPLRGRSFDLSFTPSTGRPNATIALNWPATETFTNLEEVRVELERSIRAAGVDHPALAGATIRHVVGGAFVLRAGPADYDPSLVISVVASATATALGMDPPTTRSTAQEYVLGLGSGAGSDGGAIRALDFTGSELDKTGMQALRDVDLFNILCIPAAVDSFTSSSETGAIYDAALALCADERAFLLVDPTEDLARDGADGVKLVDFPAFDTWFATYGALASPPNAALYFPRVMVADPADDFRPKAIGPSGTIAGIMARTDAERGVWQAPAGVDAVLRGVQALEVTLTDPENGVLNKRAVNCLRAFPAQGRIVWGARTLAGNDDNPSEWKYVPIRRLALFIEESLFRGTKWAVFQPNDEPLWARLRQNVGAFMHRLFRQKAFQGATPREAYFVKCDRETNPPDQRELGIVTVEVGFAPLKPAEFVVIRIQQIAEIAAT